MSRSSILNRALIVFLFFGVCFPVDGKRSQLYLCDGAPDCHDGYDEDAKLCTAARRPPVEETSSFIYSLLLTHGANHLERFLGHKAKHGLKAMGGIDLVAIALSESPTIEEFGRAVGMTEQEVENLKVILVSVEQGDIGILHSLGIMENDIGDMKYFFDNLIKTGFLG